MLLHTSVHDEVLARVAEKAGRIKIGNPLDENSQMGPLATLNQLEKIKSSVAEAQANGANLIHGGQQPSGMGDGWYYEPTILTCPNQTLAIVQQELFGPVATVLRFESERQAIDLANDTRFGLAAGIFTTDIGRALRVTKGIRSGIIWVNTYRMVSPLAPFGGFKDSGYGRESGLEAIYDYTRPKTVWFSTAADSIADPFVMQ